MKNNVINFITYSWANIEYKNIKKEDMNKNYLYLLEKAK